MEIRSQKEIIARIRLYFEKTKKSLTVISQEIGMTPRNLSMFLSLKNPHKITDKTASRLCSVYPFNKQFLMSGEGELLIAETENSSYPDRTNWTIVDYEAAISTLISEMEMLELQDYFLNLISSLFIFREKELDILKLEITSILRAEHNSWAKGLDVNTDTLRHKISIYLDSLFFQFDDTLKGYEKALEDFIYKRDYAAINYNKDLLIVKSNLPKNLSRLFEILLDES